MIHLGIEVGMGRASTSPLETASDPLSATWAAGLSRQKNLFQALPKPASRAREQALPGPCPGLLGYMINALPQWR